MDTKETVFVAEFRERAVKTAELLDTARMALVEAAAVAESLYWTIASSSENFPRFGPDVVSNAKDLARNLGGDVGDSLYVDFDIERLPTDARDLVDLVDLAASPREEVAA